MTEIFFFFFSTPEFVMDGHSLFGLQPAAAILTVCPENNFLPSITNKVNDLLLLFVAFAATTSSAMSLTSWIFFTSVFFRHCSDSIKR